MARERDDLRDHALLNPQYIESQCPPCSIAGTQHVVGHRMLQVGTCENAAKATEALRPETSVSPELEHGVTTNSGARLRGHSKDRVVADDRRECSKISLLAGIDDFLQQLALGDAGIRAGRPFGPPRGQSALKCHPRSLQCAVDRRSADVKERAGFLGGPAQDVTQDQCRPLLRREKLNHRQEREFDRFAAQRDRLRSASCAESGSITESGIG